MTILLVPRLELGNQENRGGTSERSPSCDLSLLVSTLMVTLRDVVGYSLLVTHHSSLLSKKGSRHADLGARGGVYFAG